jgi:pyruvate,water dikinase
VAFRFLLRWAGHSAPYRENLRFHALRTLEQVRLVFLEIGRRLAAAGALDRAEDVFFLEAGEALGALRGRAPGALAERARARRAAYDAAFAKVPPKFLNDDGTEAHVGPARPPAAPAPAPAPEGGAARPRVLHGVPVSGGRVTGRVRLVERLEDGWTLKPDEILLARAATPSWTPLFFFARGVILDIGGMLSHCAVIAREYGIPCVVGLKTATAAIPDGSVVTVDADRGEVVIEGG